VNIESSPFAAVVLTGGHSRRMGQDKARLAHPITGQPLLIRQLDLLAALGLENRFVAARHGQDLGSLPAGVRRVDDDGTDGPLAGIVATLTAAVDCDHLIVIPVDLPQLSVAMVAQLIAKCPPGETGVYAQTENGPEPLVSVIPAALGPALELALGRGERSPRKLFTGPLIDRMSPVYFEDPTPFQNWNAPDDI
jgi:molybdenum cofactor guanylyltransferase